MVSVWFHEIAGAQATLFIFAEKIPFFFIPAVLCDYLSLYMRSLFFFLQISNFPFSTCSLCIIIFHQLTPESSKGWIVYRTQMHYGNDDHNAGEMGNEEPWNVITLQDDGT